MTPFQRMTLFFLRIVLGWLFFYAGITKLLNPGWSAASYLKGAKTFTLFYQWLLQPQMLPITNVVNEWGLTLLGLSLIFGIFVRLSSILGAVLMLLYYFPILNFPYPNKNSLLVDQHIVYASALLLLGSLKAGRIFGLEEWCAKLPICSRSPKLRALLG